MIASLLAGLAAGALASAHCAAMCGPLAAFAHAAAPHRTLYYLARIGMYVGLGLVAGVTGSALVGAGIGPWLAFAAGGALLLHAIARARRDWWPRQVAVSAAATGLSAVITRALSRLMGASAAWIRAHRVGGPMLLGVINGLLPCGLLYAALSTAVGIGRPAESALMMAGFGVGTAPVLIVVGSSADALRRALPPRVRGALPLAFVVLAVLLIVRGLSVPAAHMH